MTFKQPTNKPTRHIYLLIEGPENSKKTSIALTVPGPTLGILNINRGLDIPEFYEAQKKLDIHVSDIPMPIGDDKVTSAEQSAALFMKDVRYSLEEFAYTLVDTGSNVWELARYAYMGAPTVRDMEGRTKEETEKIHKRGQMNYDAPNAYMRDWAYYPKEINSNIIITAHQTEIYSGGKPTGRLKQRGFKELSEICQQHIVIDKDFDCEIKRCKSNHACVGERLKNPKFTDLALMFFPDSEPSDWTADAVNR